MPERRINEEEKYIKTKPGVYKAVSLVLGLFALAFTAAADDQGVYYKDHCTPTPKNILRVVPCKHWISNSFNNCQEYLEEFDKWRSTLPKWKEKDPAKWDWADKVLDRLPNSCPSKHLVTLSLPPIALIWVTSLIMLVALHVINLNQIWSKFGKLDFIGHMVASGLLILSTLFLLAFLIWVFLENYPCHQKNNDELQKHKKLKNLGKLAAHFGVPKVARHYSNETSQSCLEDKQRVFKIWHLSIGTVFSGVAAIFYGMTGVLLRKKYGGRVTPAVELEEEEEEGEGQQFEAEPFSVKN